MPLSPWFIFLHRSLRYVFSDIKRKHGICWLPTKGHIRHEYTRNQPRDERNSGTLRGYCGFLYSGNYLDHHCLSKQASLWGRYEPLEASWLAISAFQAVKRPKLKETSAGHECLNYHYLKRRTCTWRSNEEGLCALLIKSFTGDTVLQSICSLNPEWLSHGLCWVFSPTTSIAILNSGQTSLWFREVLCRFVLRGEFCQIIMWWVHWRSAINFVENYGFSKATEIRYFRRTETGSS